MPYGEIAFDRSRLDVLRDLLTKLEAQNFHGVVKVTSAAGLYCLSGNATDGYQPAASNLPVSRCDLIGNPLDDALSGQQRQSLAFANLVAGVRQRTGGAITVALESAGSAAGQHAVSGAQRHSHGGRLEQSRRGEQPGRVFGRSHP